MFHSPRRALSHGVDVSEGTARHPVMIPRQYRYSPAMVQRRFDNVKLCNILGLDDGVAVVRGDFSGLYRCPAAVWFPTQRVYPPEAEPDREHFLI